MELAGTTKPPISMTSRLQELICAEIANVKERIMFHRKTNVDIGNHQNTSKRLYELERRPGEEWINDYCPAILLGWNGNVDCQYVGNNKGIVPYITSYTTKGEISKKVNELRETGTSTTKSKAIYAFGIDEMNSREVGLLEMCDELLGHPNFAFDMAEVWIPTDEKHRRSRMMNSKARIEAGGDVFLSNLLDVYYPQRSNDLESYCLYNLATNFAVRCSKANPDSETEDGSRKFEKRDETYDRRYKEIICETKKKVGRFFVPQFSVDDLGSLEEFHRRMSMKPWRTGTNMLETYNKDSYSSLFLDYMDTLESTSPIAHKELSTFLASFVDMKKEQTLIRTRMQNLNEALKELNVDEDEDELQVQARSVDVDKHNENVSKLNEEQSTLFNMIIQNVRKSQEPGGANVLYYCSGTAGVGKSFLIDCLADALELEFGDIANGFSTPAVLLSAPTGLSAISIGGQTLHSLFAIEVQSGSESSYHSLSDEKRDLRRALFSNVKLIIIDEISMCGSIMLAKIRNRLREIGKISEEFGGFNIVVFGDLLQLPPVRAPPVFSGLSKYTARKIFGGCGAPNLWHNFKFFELVTNMRQREDRKYAEILGRLRINKLNDDDKLELGQRIIATNMDVSELLTKSAHYFVILAESDPFVMTLFPTKLEVDEFNLEVLRLMGAECVSITANDTIKDANKGNRKQRPWQTKEFNLMAKKDSNERKPTIDMIGYAGGLRSTLVIAKNCRIMLRRNLDKVRGLVNGLTGVLEIIHEDFGEITKLGIRFDRIPDEITWVRKLTVMYETKSGQRASRTQFPLELAYACTVHKSQGLTLNNVIVSTRRMFSDGQFFVAASRVRAITGLHLIDCDLSKVKSNKFAIEEYARLGSTAIHSEDSTEQLKENRITDTETEVYPNHLTTASNSQFLKDYSTNQSLGLRDDEDHMLRTGTVGIPLTNTVQSCRTVVNTLLKVKTNEAFYVELTRLLTGRSKDVTLLRSLFPDRELHNGQQDVGRAWDQLTEKLPYEVFKSIKFTTTTTWKCELCGDAESSLHDEIILTTVAYETTSVAELFEDDTSTRTFSESTRHLCVKIYKTREKTYISDLDNEIFQFAENEWTPIGLVEYIPAPNVPYSTQGHYVSWIKSRN
ncbi:unnamed protein product [Caenorhabditis sp. 36 PRJEB53466]|nr:unnamed protein product [Caenorhabditis sp. 36 PRJEB53466]